MSELTNIHARSVKDLTTPSSTPADSTTFDQVKLVAGNFPTGYTGNEAVTIGLVKELAAQGREAELEEVFQKIAQEETRAKEVESLLSQNKAEKTYVDSELDAQNIKVNNHLSEQTQVVTTALTQLSTAANKFYPTLAAANADIANIAVNQPVTVGEVTNGGLWYKATTGATSLTKSPYDPLTQAKADATTKANTAKSEVIEYVDNHGLEINVSKLSNNYLLGLQAAIALVPALFRKAGTIIRFNESQLFQFKGAYTAARFDDIRWWFNLAGIKNPDSKNIIGNAALHKGFVIHNGSNTYYHPDNRILIGELDRNYTGAILNLTGTTSLGINTINWLDANFNVLGGNAFQTPHANAKYYAINVAYFNGTNLISNEQAYKRAYVPRNGEEVNTYLAIAENAEVRSYTTGLIKYTNSFGESFLKSESDIFVSPNTLVKLRTEGSYVYLSELVTDVEIFFGPRGDKNKQTGKTRRAFISYLSVGSTGQATIRISVENPIFAGEFYEHALTSQIYDNSTLADSDFVTHVNAQASSERYSVRINVAILKKYAGSVLNLFTVEESEINPSHIRERYANAYNYKGCKINLFEMYGVSLVSNYTHQPPESKLGNKVVANGVKNYILTGDSGKRHQQCALSGEVQTLTMSGMKTLNIFGSVEVASNYTLPELTTFRVTSGTEELLGNQNSQYIHPDIEYSQTPIGGFNYHMINSIYPYSNPSYEDAEIFVSNDALNWQRIPAANEVYTGPLTIKLPPTYWDVADDRKNLFMPIPKVDAVMQFATDTADANNTVTRFLNHDPFCLYLNGYIYYYCIYNLGLTGSTTTNHRYTFCYRTNDYVSWEVAREDGTWYPYNQENAALMFSKTNGLRNHMRYRNSVSANEAAPQVVRVSDTKYYYYTTDLQNTIYRYTGTSPTQFDFSTKETIVFSGATIDRVWHCAVEYIDGKFYLIYGGRLCESTDGITFTVPVAPFFWVGMSADLYKPSITIGESGKVKVAYSLQPNLAYEHSYEGNNLGAMPNPTTVCCEFPSLDYVKKMGESFRQDAFIDLALVLTNEKTRKNKTYRFFGIKNTKKIKNIVEVDTGDLVSATVYLNTRSNGVANFKGIILDERS